MRERVTNINTHLQTFGSTILVGILLHNNNNKSTKQMLHEIILEIPYLKRLH